MSFVGEDRPPLGEGQSRAPKKSLKSVLTGKFSETLTEALETPEGQKIFVKASEIIAKFEGEQGKVARDFANAIFTRVLVLVIRRRKVRKALMQLGLSKQDAKAVYTIFSVAMDNGAARVLGEKKTVDEFYEKLGALKNINKKG